MSMIKAQPLLFLGDSRRQAVSARVNDKLRQWRMAWSKTAEQFELVIEACGDSLPVVASATTSCWSLELNGERLAVLVLPHGSFCWAVQENAVLPEIAISGEPGSLTEWLEQEVARSLLSAICDLDKQDGVAITRVAGELEVWSRDTRAWQLQARPASGGRGFTLLLAATRMEMLTPARRPRAGDLLDSRRHAIGGNTVTLRALVGGAAMNVGELANLALDDVLVLDRQLSECVSLVSAHTGSDVAACHLGRSGGNRAIKIAGEPAQKN